MASTSSSSSSPYTKKTHELFISFRGQDVRRSLLSHLKRELCRRRIDFYVDDVKLDRGDEISSSLLKAIEGSQIALVIFSKDYASSKWCLEELTKIIECMETNNQIVLPVFYNVSPSDVRHQRGDYGIAMAEHEAKYKDNNTVYHVQKWRDALKKAAQLSGFDYPTQFMDESDLIDKIVDNVLEKLSQFFISDSNGFVGIDQSITEIEFYLDFEPEVPIIGISGMPGIGKTTLARRVYDKIHENYDGCCFLENVKEKAQICGLSDLLEELQAELLRGENIHSNGTSKEKLLISSKLRQKQVLIVLDDVDSLEQLKHLVGEPFSFGPGSRVIVTSRDENVLRSGGAHKIHEVKQLNYQESRKLFCLHAFNASHPTMGYEELFEETIINAKGNPLAIKVLGSHFHSKSIATWECELKKLIKYPNKEIQGVLHLSYDGLDYLEKKVFLDIAFFFKEEDKDYVIRQLNVWGFNGTSRIDALQRKALITISGDNKIQMHDLIQEMGWEIVRQESIRHPGHRNRLRDNDEVYDVLTNIRGTDAVEGIVIDTCKLRNLSLTAETFEKMPNLRIVKIYHPVRAEVPAIVWATVATSNGVFFPPSKYFMLLT